MTMLIYVGRFDPCTHTKCTANTLAGKETDRKTVRMKMSHQSTVASEGQEVQNNVARNRSQLTLTDNLIFLMNNKQRDE